MDIADIENALGIKFTTFVSTIDGREYMASCIRIPRCHTNGEVVAEANTRLGLSQSHSPVSAGTHALAIEFAKVAKELPAHWHASTEENGKILQFDGDRPILTDFKGEMEWPRGWLAFICFPVITPIPSYPAKKPTE